MSKLRFAQAFRFNTLSPARLLRRSFSRNGTRIALGATLLGFAALQAGRLSAQQVTLLSADASSSSSSAADPSPATALPDAPGFAAPAAGTAAPVHLKRAPGHFDKVIEPGQTAARFTIPDKVLFGIRENATVFSLAGWFASATYEQIVNSSPNYGQTGKGYAQRLGAAAARGASENIMSDSIIAPLTHEDPRYYKMGPGNNFFKRLAYSGTRVLYTRTDGGRRTINFATLGGDLGGAAMTQIYYPPGNRNFTEVMSTWGSSIGGDAVGYIADEFLGGFLTSIHLKPSN